MPGVGERPAHTRKTMPNCWLIIVSDFVQLWAIARQLILKPPIHTKSLLQKTFHQSGSTSLIISPGDLFSGAFWYRAMYILARVRCSNSRKQLGASSVDNARSRARPRASAEPSFAMM